MPNTALDVPFVQVPARVSAVPEEEFQLRSILAGLIRRRGLMLTVGLIAATIVFTALMLRPTRYESTALVMISPGQEQVLGAEKSLAGGGKPDTNLVDSQIEILQSRAMATRLAKAMKLSADPRWVGAQAARQPTNAPSAALVDQVQKAIEVRRRGLTYVVEVTVTAPSPAQAAKMANTLVALLGQAQVEAARGLALRANEWLAQRVETLREELRVKEAAVERYRIENGLMTADGVSLTESQINNVQTAALSAEADLAEKAARYNQVNAIMRTGGSPESVAGVLNSEVIRDLRAKESEIAQRQADAEKRYGELHPTLNNIKAERADIQRQLQAETQRILAGLRSELDVARSRVAALNGNLNSARGELQANTDAQVSLRELERDAAAARAVFEAFLQRSHEISQQGNLGDTDIRLVSSATQPTSPSQPNFVTALLIAIALGAGAGLVAALIANYLDDRIESVDDIERDVGAEAIASIPATTPAMLRGLPLRQRHPAAYLAKHPMSGFAEAFRVLRAALVYGPRHEQRKIVAVTSALPGEGKTTSALCLARIAAMSGERVMLIDCDLRRRGLNNLLDITPDHGLLEVLNGERRWQGACGVDELSGAHVLPVRPGDVTTRDVLGSQAMRRLLDDLREHYDMIVLDCAPVLALAETRAAASLADAVVVIGSWRKTHARALGAAIGHLQTAGAQVAGVALNRIDMNAPGRTSYRDTLYYSDVQKAYYHA